MWTVPVRFDGALGQVLVFRARSVVVHSSLVWFQRSAVVTVSAFYVVASYRKTLRVRWYDLLIGSEISSTKQFIVDVPSSVLTTNVGVISNYICVLRSLRPRCSRTGPSNCKGRFEAVRSDGSLFCYIWLPHFSGIMWEWIKFTPDLYRIDLLSYALRLFLVHTMFSVYKTALPIGRCHILVGGTQVVQRVRWLICRFSGCSFYSFRYSGKGMIHVSASWPAVEVVSPEGLLRRMVKQVERILYVAHLVGELLYCEPLYVNPPALGLLGKCRSSGFLCLR